MRTLIGPLINPDGSPMAGVNIRLRAQRVNWSGDGLVAKSSEQLIVTSDTGDFAQPVADGDYQVWLEIPETGGEERLGGIVIADGDPVELGELIELSRDASADWSISASWATRAWVLSQITVGAVPYAISITAFNPGAGTAGQLYRVSGTGLLLEAFTPQLNAWAIGNGVPKGMLYEKPDGKIGTLPAPRTITANTLAVIGDSITANMNAAAGDIDITLPAGWVAGDPDVTVFIVSDPYQLPHNINIIRNGAQTIMGFAADLQITRRRVIVFRRVGANDVRFN